MPFFDLRYRFCCAAWSWPGAMHFLRPGFVGGGAEEHFWRNLRSPTLGRPLAACCGSAVAASDMRFCFILTLTQVLWSKDANIFEAALARIGEVSPDVAEFEEAAKSFDLETVGQLGHRPQLAEGNNAESEPCTAANDSP